MDKGIKKLYKEALGNKEFDRDMVVNDPIDYYRPTLFAHKIAKIMYATAYYGWLLSRGEYNREKYY